MTTPKRRRVAVIGLGMAVTPHAKSLLDLAERAEVAAAVSRSEERRRAFAARFPFPVTGDLDAVIADPSVDAVLLLTPPNARIEIIERLAAAGKHVLMEKPVERTTAAAVRIVETMERAGLRLGIVFQHRFRPAAERLRALVAGRGLGEPAAAHIVLPWWRPQTYYDEPGRGTLARDGGGVLLSQAIHTLDLALSLTGPASEVAAVAGTTRVHRMETEDFVGAGLRFANGAMGALTATTAQYPGFPERIELVGTEATAVLAGGDLAVFHRDGRTDRFGEDQGTGGGADPMDFPHDAHRGVLTDFLDALDEGRGPRVSGREALRVHRFIDALLRSSAEGRAVPVEGEETGPWSRGREELRFAAIGLDHRHIYHQVGRLLEAGATCVGWWTGDLDALPVRGFVERFPDLPRVDDRRRLLDDPSIKLVVTAAVPVERAGIAVAAMRHGKDVMTDKPGVITFEQFEAVRRTQAETGRIWSVNFSERYEVRAVTKAAELIEAGAIGRVVQTVGLGPHRRNAHLRPDWFWDPARNGGILADIATHQIDQFLYLTGSTDAEIVTSAVANYANPEHPEFQDFGELLLRSDRANGYVRVDWYTPDGLPTWGDGRLTILGTEGYIELRKYIDIAGRPGGDHLFLVTNRETRHIECAGAPLPYYERLRDDVLNRTETAMSQGHCFKVCELALRAQAQAKRLA